MDDDDDDDVGEDVCLPCVCLVEEEEIGLLMVRFDGDDELPMIRLVANSKGNTITATSTIKTMMAMPTHAVTLLAWSSVSAKDVLVAATGGGCAARGGKGRTGLACGNSKGHCSGGLSTQGISLYTTAQCIELQGHVIYSSCFTTTNTA